MSPRIGRPAFLKPGGRQFEVVVAFAPEVAPAEILAGTFRLREVGGKRTVALHVVGHDEVDPPRAVPHLEQGWRAATFVLGLPAGPPGLGRSRRFVLFDLWHPIAGTAPHAVVCLHRADDLTILFAADLHVADAWRDVEKRIEEIPHGRASISERNLADPERLFSRESYRECFVNPNRNLVALIDVANGLVDRGELDVLILGGDLVDYVYRSYGTWDGSYGSTNFHLLERLLLGGNGGRELRAPVLTTTGNHDYRQQPYRFSVHGLRHCGLHDYQTMFLYRLRRTPSLLFPTVRDIRSVLVRKGRRHPLLPYFRSIAPEPDHGVSLAGVPLIMLDTGRDAWLNAARTSPRRWGGLIPGFGSGLDVPYSEGLDDHQLASIERRLREADPESDVLIVFHAGLFNPGERGSPRKAALELDLPVNPGGDLAWSGERLERYLRHRGWTTGCIFRNQASLLVAARYRRIVGLSGHTHRRLESGIHWPKVIVESSTLEDGSTPGASVFLTTSALGHVEAHYSPPQRPGYYLLRLRSGAVTQMDWRLLKASPLDALRFSLSDEPVDSRTRRLVARIEIAREAFHRSVSGLRLVVTLILLQHGGPRVDRVQIRPSRELGFDAAQCLVLDEDTARRYFGGGRRKKVTVHSWLLPVSRELTFDLTPRSALGRRDEVVGVVELAEPHAAGWTILRSSWHPCSLTPGSD